MAMSPKDVTMVQTIIDEVKKRDQEEALSAAAVSNEMNNGEAIIDNKISSLEPHSQKRRFIELFHGAMKKYDAKEFGTLIWGRMCQMFAVFISTAVVLVPVVKNSVFERVGGNMDSIRGRLAISLLVMLVYGVLSFILV